VIVINVNDHPAVVVVSGMEAFAAASGNRMSVCKSVNLPVKEDTPLHLRWILLKVLSANPVCNEISKAYLWVIKRKVNVGEIVHNRKNTQIKEVLSDYHNNEAIFVCF
jgi:hypothetical protein